MTTTEKVTVFVAEFNNQEDRDLAVKAVARHRAGACLDCGAVNETCCAVARRRLETNDTFERLTRRQSETIGTLTRQLAEAKQVQDDLRRRLANTGAI